MLFSQIIELHYLEILHVRNKDYTLNLLETLEIHKHSRWKDFVH